MNAANVIKPHSAQTVGGRKIINYSNCVFEAVIAKLKDPEHIRIILFKPHTISEVFHVGWTDGEYFYHAYDHNFKSRNHFLYKPTVKKVPFIVFESWIRDNLKSKPIEFQKKMMKECGIHLIDIPYTDCSCWCWICDESDLPKEEDVRYMEKVFRSKVFIKVVKQDEGMQVMTYEQIKQMRITNDEHLYGWRYVTPMDSADYNGLYGNHIRVSTRELSDDIVDPPLSRPES